MGAVQGNVSSCGQLQSGSAGNLHAFDISRKCSSATGHPQSRTVCCFPAEDADTQASLAWPTSHLVATREARGRTERVGSAQVVLVNQAAQLLLLDSEVALQAGQLLLAFLLLVRAEVVALGHLDHVILALQRAIPLLAWTATLANAEGGTESTQIGAEGTLQALCSLAKDGYKCG